jgi:hypothetical protein
MKILGFLILLAGWVIILSALVLLAKEGARGVFVFAGVGVEGTGLALVIRAHMPSRSVED